MAKSEEMGNTEKTLRLVSVGVLLASAVALVAIGERGFLLSPFVLGAILIGRRVR